jgi:hypothetical protein
MNTQYMLLGLYEKPFLNLRETCTAIGISYQTGCNMRTNHAFPIPMLDSPVRASIIDIAEYIDKQREIAKAKRPCNI